MITLPSDQTPISLADWLEASLLIEGPSRVSIAAISDVLQESEYGNADMAFENLDRTIQERQRILKECYPIVRDGEGFAVNEECTAWLVYSFMLFTSLNLHYRELRFTGGTANKPAEFFEHLTLHAVKNYWTCDAVRLGAPRRKPVPSDFPNALKWLARQINEAIGQEDIEQQNSGDDGVDIVGWRTFGDRRQGQAIILTQCAIGNDWRSKRNEISCDLWRRHVDWHVNPPMRGFAVPFHHESGGPWRETSTTAGIIFDRLRIAKLVAAPQLEASLAKQITAWCRNRIAAIQKLSLT
jgi:hypothetical protein